MSMQYYSYIRNMSLFIPHVFVKYSPEYIVHVFERLLIGKVNYVEFIPKLRHNQTVEYYNICVYFDYWYDNTATRNLQKKITSKSKEARIVYDDPWYWLVYENGVMKNEIQEREEVIKKPIQRYERKQVLYLGDNKPKDYENDLASEIEIEKLFKKYNIKKCQLENGEVIEDKKNTIIVSTC